MTNPHEQHNTADADRPDWCMACAIAEARRERRPVDRFTPEQRQEINAALGRIAEAMRPGLERLKVAVADLQASPR